ncbi:protein phosphatase 1 regulatory inhibitor subunit PPP1R8 homolog [Nymphaea colorata]|nr:protein phosphatase 1 regulatory inhibitor subunit PPP1R8 homolog [Nymphaea colorata]
MYGRAGLDRFKKGQSLEPFSVTFNSSSKQPVPGATQVHQAFPSSPTQNKPPQLNLPAKVVPSEPVHLSAQAAQVTSVGGGQSNWQPPDWSIEPRPGVYFLEVLKDGQVLDIIGLDKRRHIFGRQYHTCDFVLDHPSVSRQHAAVVPHKNGSIFVIDLGSVHGTFVANERLTKDNPVEVEVGQSLRFAASTRTYILRKNTAALFPTASVPKDIVLPSPPDPSDEEAVLAYNTILNRYGVSKVISASSSAKDNRQTERPAKRQKRLRVGFKDQVGGDLVEVVGFSDGADVETEPGPIGVKEGSLVGKYESLVQVTVIPKGQEQISPKPENTSSKGVTDKLQQVINKVKVTPKTGIYDDLYEDSVPGKMGSSWAYASGGNGDSQASAEVGKEGKSVDASKDKSNTGLLYDDDDDLFGD